MSNVFTTQINILGYTPLLILQVVGSYPLTPEEQKTKKQASRTSQRQLHDPHG